MVACYCWSIFDASVSWNWTIHTLLLAYIYAVYAQIALNLHSRTQWPHNLFFIKPIFSLTDREITGYFTREKLFYQGFFDVEIWSTLDPAKIA